MTQFPANTTRDVSAPFGRGGDSSTVRLAFWPTFAVAAILAIGCSTLSCPAETGSAQVEAPGPAEESGVRTLTGAHTRLVCVQGDGTDPFAFGTNLVLMGLDSDDARGERVILSQRGSYMKPLLTSRGTQIVYSTRPSPDADADVMVVDWNGTGTRRLAKGYALAVWADPADGREWVYVGLDRRGDTFRSIQRIRLDRPGSTEPVWDRTAISADSFQLTADGRLAGGLFPWPDAGVAELPNGPLRKLGEGCWTALADVGTPLFWYFDGSHRNLTMVDLEADARWTVNITGAPGFANAEAYHPRWTNHPRFLTVTGPYNQGGQNQVRSGGAQAEVWLGRFAADYSHVEAWTRVTRNSGGDAYPDVWIDRGQSRYQSRRAGSVGPSPATAAPPAGAGGRVTLSARLVAPGAIPTPRSIAPYRHALVASVYEIVRIDTGSYDGQRILVAQWAIRDGAVISGARRRQAGTVYDLTVEPYDTHPELEGERLIMGDEAAGLRLYYDVGPVER